MDFRTPVYIQLKEAIREQIEGGEIGIGEAIPSERKLSEIYGLNRITVRNAIAGLVEEGLLKRIQGKGTFVIKPKMERDLVRLQGFSSILQNKGLKPHTRVIYTEKREAGEKFSRIFGIDEKTVIYKILRLRFADEEPNELEETYLPYELLPSVETIDFEIASLYETFREKGILLDRGEQTLKMAKVADVEAELLELPYGSSVFLFECCSYDKSNRVVEFTRAYTRSDKSVFLAELKSLKVI